ncbi:piggyBac transposable element-derived protein 4-like [Brienomyrus brachyistius]|uniref:piggyBac transposable element-derived protein 4-like n=1 Tax=Brienomyrus brachyistius TaxID=42636 RepID=UPI0020B2E31D|nr:piggyBac transposable element-derived protein 4-like [Brienomyrus brachyistius]
MTTVELDAFIGVCILAGVFKSKGESVASLWESKFGRPIFPAIMSRVRFEQLTVALRFDDKGSWASRRTADKIALIRDIWDLWSGNLPAMYNLGHDLTVDECLVPFKGRCSFRQYMPRKPGRYGQKIWALCDARTSYCWRVKLYT